jgi:hypothetical protein
MLDEKSLKTARWMARMDTVMALLQDLMRQENMTLGQAKAEVNDLLLTSVRILQKE